MKVLWWALCLAALVGSAVLASRGSDDYTVVVRGPSAGGPEKSGVVACPPRTLPDDRACVPVPRPRESPDLVPRFPSRPEAFESYELPTSGEVLEGSWADVEGDGTAPLSGPAWIFAAREASLVVSVALGGQPPVLHARDGDWVLLAAGAGAASDPRPRPLALLGPIEVTPGLTVGAQVAPGAVLGRARRFGVGLAVRELRPNEALSEGFGTLDDARSVAVDPRNVLTLRDEPGR